MAHLYRPTSVKPVPKNAVIRTVKGSSGRPDKKTATWTNRKNRAVTAELTPDGTKCRVPSPTWWIEYTDAGGKRVRAPGFRDRAATLQLAATLERNTEDVRAGRESPRRTAPEHMTEQLANFTAALERKGCSEGHIADTVKQIRTVLTRLDLTTPGAVDRERVEQWLDAEQKRLGWGARTRNQWAGSLNQFGRWLVKVKKSNVNPFDGLARQNVETDRRVVRRVLEPDDLNRLVVAARDSPDAYHGLSGTDRAVLYLIAAYTGRRLGALKQMSRADIQFENGLPVTITTGARLQKSKKVHSVPVHPELARDLAAWLAGRPARGPLFTGWKTWADRGAELIRHDLAVARATWIEEAGENRIERERREESDRLKYHDSAGEVFDFHALRGQFVTSLAMAGVELTAAQQLADHSDPKLTANVYTRWKNKLAGEVAKLPAPGVRLQLGLGSGLGSDGERARQEAKPTPDRKREKRRKP